MKVAEPTAPEGVVRVKPIAASLPSLLPSVARAARIGHDRRLGHDLRTLLGANATPVFAGRPSTERLSIALQCAQGGLEVALDPDDWPALRLAAAAGDEALVRDVVDALLAPLAARLAPWLPALKVRSLRRYPASTITSGGLPSMSPDGATVTLVRIDATLADHLDTRLRASEVVGLARYAALRLPVRLRVLERRFSRERLHALSPGDIVLCGAGRRRGSGWHASLLFGLGIAMQADADFDLGAKSARLATPPRPFDEDAATASADFDGAPLENLQVPVAFEIDSARISLAELASLDAGSVIELDVPLLEAGVRLVSHGQTLGLGQLVAIGDQLGVRIRRMGLGGAADGRTAP